MSILNELPSCWRQALESRLPANTLESLQEFLIQETKCGEIVYPPRDEIFAAFWATRLEQVRVVILGQDPYHNESQAHGLSFSVRPEVAIPPSLKNIYKELESDLGINMPAHGYLMGWANQGVLLLNNVLTVRAHQPATHQGKGWEIFTDAVIDILNAKNHLVFLLWGAPAQKKAAKVDQQKHCVLKAPHPSPLSAYRGFLGCRHFSMTNNYLRSQGLGEVDWSSLPIRTQDQEIEV